MVEVFVNDIRNALKNQSYFSALALALALPDICAYAEYPDKEDKVGQRYISWYDKYIGQQLKKAGGMDKLGLNGELVYNLRNTYLHQGSPNVDSSRIKEEANQVDAFVLLLGDGKIHMMGMNVSCGKANVRMIIIDVTFLCRIICESSLSYYYENKEKFRHNFSIITEEEMLGKNSPLDNVPKDADPIGDIMLKKLYGENHTIRFENNVTQSLRTQIKTGNYTRIDSLNRESLGKSIENKPETCKKEHSVRCFYGQAFKDKKYKDKKELIIAAMIGSETKTQLNMALTKIMPGEDVKEVLKRLKPYIKDWPGQ